jgi:hypothetical protein
MKRENIMEHSLNIINKDIEELKGIVQQLVSKFDSYDQQTNSSYRESHRGYQQGFRGTYRPPRQNYQSRQQTQLLEV